MILGTLLVLLSIVTYLLLLIVFSETSPDRRLDKEWLKEGASMIVIILAELGTVAVILEERLRSHFEEQYTKLKEILETERREGRNYIIKEKQMIFDYRPKEKVLKYTEINHMLFEGKEKHQKIDYPIYYDVKKEIRSLLVKDGCPRVRAYIIEEDYVRELTLRERTINGNSFIAFINPDVGDSEEVKLRVDRCYGIDELDTYFTRVIQDPVNSVTIRFDWHALHHLLGIKEGNKENNIKKDLINKIKIIGFNTRETDRLFKWKIKIDKNGATIQLEPKSERDRPRLFIMDRIQIRMDGTNEALGAPQG